MSKYPRITEHWRLPNKERDGRENYGKPCVVCGKNTAGGWHVQVDYMRGNDEVVRACCEHFFDKEAILAAMGEEQ